MLSPWDQGVLFTPDQEQALLYAADGVRVLDVATGGVQMIAVPIKAIGISHDSWVPGAHWLDDNRFYILIPTADGFNDELIGPNATFTVWEVNTAAATAQPVNTFKGFALEAQFSPGLGRLAAWTQRGADIRTLFLADVAGGQQIEYAHGPRLEFFGWSSDGERFVYQATDGHRRLMMGHVCAPPQPLDIQIPYATAWQWVDATRFLVLEGGLNEMNPELELHMRSLDGEDVLIATFNELYPLLNFHFE